MNMINNPNKTFVSAQDFVDVCLFVAQDSALQSKVGPKPVR